MMIDALIGTLIISLFLAIAIVTAVQARSALERAGERHRALARLQAAIEITPRRPHTETLVTAGFQQSINVEREDHAGHALCRIDAVVRGIKSQHLYRLSSVRWCDDREPVSAGSAE